MRAHARSVSRIATPLAVAGMLFVTPAQVQAQDYTGIVLYRLQVPPGFDPFAPFGSQVGISNGNEFARSYGDGFTSAGHVVGTGRMTQDGSVRHALLWSGPSGTPVDLHPAGGYQATACFAIDGAKQVGYGYFPNRAEEALLWSGTAASVVSLHPLTGFSSSSPTGVGGGQQVGLGDTSTIPFGTHALVWSGTAESVVDLHPGSGYGDSVALATNGTQQVGYGITSDRSAWYHALLWSGTAASVVDLHPASGYFNTHAIGLSSNQQVGYASNFSPETAHAMLWTGTSASHVDLHPGIGYDNSYATAAGGGKQVGWGHIKGGFTHALLWSGTAGSIVDLHSLLPAPVGALFNSFASSIDANGNIFGIADDFAGTVYAVEWSLRQAKLVNTSTGCGCWPAPMF